MFELNEQINTARDILKYPHKEKIHIRVILQRHQVMTTIIIIIIKLEKKIYEDNLIN